MRHALALVASASLAALAGLAVPATPAFAQPGQQSRVEVPAEHAAMGKVYRVHAVKDAQMTFTSDAPLEHIKGISNRVTGYAVAPSSADKPEGQLLGATCPSPRWTPASCCATSTCRATAGPAPRAT